MATQLSRRALLGYSAMLACAPLLAACGQTPSAETNAPTATTASAGATAKPGQSGAPAASTTVASGQRLVEIDYWHRVTGDGLNRLEVAAEEFNQLHAGRIKVVSGNQGNIADLNKKVRAAAAGGGLPGALMADDYDVTQYAFSNIIVPLDSYIADREYGLSQEQRNDFLPGQLDRHKLPIYGDRTMAFPQGFSAFTMFWNVDALERAGFDAPPKVWSEFPDHVRATAKANPDMAGWFISGAGDRFISTLLTSGVDWLTPDGRASNFDNPEALEIMTWWRELSDEKLLAVPTESARELFEAQRCAYYMDSSGSVGRFSSIVKNFKWDGGLPPQADVGVSVITETYGPVNTLPKTNDDVQLAGWLWLKYLASPEPQAKYALATTYFPSVKSAADSTLLKEYMVANPTYKKLFEEVAPYARILSPSPALTEVRGQITANVVNEVLLGRLSPEEGVKKLKAEADKAIQNALPS